MTLFNLLYRKIFDNDNSNTKIKLLCGLLYLKTNNLTKEISIRLFGIPFLQSKLKDSLLTFYFLFIPVYIYNINHIFLNEFLTNLTNKYNNYDDFYIFLSRSGEFYLLMHHFMEWLHSNKSNNFILIFTAKYHMNICKIFIPNVPMVCIPNLKVAFISRAIKSTIFTYNQKRIIIPTYEKYFVDVENNIRFNNAHYYSELKKHLNLSDKCQSYKISDSANHKAKAIAEGLLNKNFVLISPETLSNVPIQHVFWENLCIKLKEKGYEIFCHTMNFSNLIDGTNSVFLTHEESIALAKYAKAVIGIRSGFIECLSANKMPLFVLYTDFPNRSGFKRLASSDVLNGYTISKLPNVNQNILYEYDMNKYENEEDLITEILNKMKLLDTNKAIKGVNNGQSR